jgi:hypothetical protein
MRPPINRKSDERANRICAQARRAAGRQRLSAQSGVLNRGRHRLAFDSFPGRTIALAFLGSASDPGTDAALQMLSAHRRLVEGGKAAFFAVVSDPDSTARDALETRFPAVRFLWDGESLASAFGAARAWVVLDPMLRVVDVAPLDEHDRVMGRLDQGAAPSQAFSDCPPAPILTLADVLEPELCHHLVDCFERGGGRESGFMQDVEGRGSSISTTAGSAGAIFC